MHSKQCLNIILQHDTSYFSFELKVPLGTRYGRITTYCSIRFLKEVGTRYLPDHSFFFIRYTYGRYRYVVGPRPL